MSTDLTGHPPHGWLNIDKPAGMTSFDVIRILKRALSLPRKHKIGHTGTLDPMATGVLAIALGEATKLIHYVEGGQKVYQAEITFGAETDSDDVTGAITRTTDHLPTLEEFTSILPQFTGRLMQIPPNVSAVHLDGERAYALARRGEAVELTPRPVDVHSIAIISHVLQQDKLKSAVVNVACGRGTYIRSLARDIGRALGSYAHLSSLRRTQSGGFTLADALPLHNSLENPENPDINTQLITGLKPISDALDDILAITVSESDARRIRSGLSVDTRNPDHSPVAIFCKDALVAMGKISGQQLSPTRVLNT